MKLFAVLSLSLVAYAVIQDQTNKDEALDIKKEVEVVAGKVKKDFDQAMEKIKAEFKKEYEAQMHSTSYKPTPTYDPNYYNCKDIECLKNLGYNFKESKPTGPYTKQEVEVRYRPSMSIEKKYLYGYSDASKTSKVSYKSNYAYASSSSKNYYKPSKSYGYGYGYGYAAKESKSYNKYYNSYYGKYNNYKSYPSSASYNHYNGNYNYGNKPVYSGNYNNYKSYPSSTPYNHNYDTKPYCYLHVGSTSMRLNEGDMNLLVGIVIGLLISLLIGSIGLLVFYIYMKNKTNKVIEKKEDEKSSLESKSSIWHWLLIFLLFVFFGYATVPFFVVIYLGYMLRMNHDQNQVERETDIEAAVEHVHTEVSIDDNQTITKVDVDVDVKIDEAVPLLIDEKEQ